MNIIDIQDSLKNFSEDQLIKEMQMPSGNAPQFLVLSEIQRRKRVRDDFSKRQAAQEPTVAEEAVAAAGVPMQGIAGMSEAMAPQSAVSEGIGTIMPQAMRQAPNAPVPEAEDIAMPMRSGGLLGYGQDRIDPFLDEVGQIAAEHFGQPSETDGQDNPQQPPGFGPPMPGIFRPNRPTRPRPFDPVLTQPFMPSQPAFGSSRPRLPVKGGGVTNGSRSLRFSGLGQYAPVQRYDEGGLIKAQNGLPLGLRQRNPGNIRPGAGFIGESGDGGGYATFGSDDEGLRAIQRLLMTYGDKYDIKTLRQLANRYAPPSDNNPTGNYIDFLSDKTGIGPDDEINLAESGSSIIPAIVGFEQGQQPYSQAQIDRAIRAAGTDDPKEVAEILGKPLSDDILNQRLDQEPDILSSLMGARADDGSSESDKPSEAEIKAKVDAMKRAGGLGQYKGTVPNLGGSGVVVQDIDDLSRAAAKNAQTATNQIGTSAEQGASALEVGDRVDDAQAASDKTAIIQAKSKDMSVPVLENEAAKNNKKAQDLLDEADNLEIIAKKSPPAVKDTLEKQVEKKRAEAGKLVTSAQDQSSQAADAAVAAESQRSSLVPDEGTIDTKKSTDDKDSTDDKSSVDNEPIKPPVPDAPKVESEDTSIEAEILKMQDDLKKGREQDKWLAIAQAGLALMSSKEPTLLGAAGEAGVSGLKAYREAQDRYQEGVIDLVNARAKLDKSKKPAIAQKDILDAQVEIMKDPMATPTERARAKSIVDSIVGGAGFGLVDLRSQAAS